MSGIYFHIPFCRQACHYCDFHFSTSLRFKEDMISAMEEEIRLRQDYLPDKHIDTIYFGGGTPSLLSEEDLNRLMESVYEYFSVRMDAEITLEANPDDLSVEKIRALKAAGINRLSIGIQSFLDRDLKWMNRAHSAEEAVLSVKRSQDMGIENITIDLIYGLPQLRLSEWEYNLEQAFELDVPHISSYCLTIEEKTPLAAFVKKGKVAIPEEDQSVEQFKIMLERMKERGYIQYEISNFGKEGYFSEHNSSYWKGIPYLGIGPSAHSFDGKSRQWNMANNKRYIDQVAAEIGWFEKESLSKKERFNERIMVGLRTMWGIDLSKLRADFGSDEVDELRKRVFPYVRSGDVLETSDDHLLLTEQGRILADRIAMDCFL